MEDETAVCSTMTTETMMVKSASMPLGEVSDECTPLRHSYSEQNLKHKYVLALRASLQLQTTTGAPFEDVEILASTTPAVEMASSTSTASIADSTAEYDARLQRCR